MGKNLDVYEYVGRHEELAFIKFRKPKMSPSETNKHCRMEGFTSLSDSKNAKTRERQYVDEKASRTSTTGYSPSIAYNFDRYAHLTIHDELRFIHDNDMIGADAECEIIVVDMATTAEDGKFNAYKRNYSVVPDGKGDTTDAMTYSGTFRGNGEVTRVKVTLDDSDPAKAYLIDSVEEVTASTSSGA